MARVLETIVKVRDAASSKLKKIDNSFKNTGRQVKKTGMDFKQFNRTLFTTTAFIGVFQRTFDVFTRTLDMGADLNRLTNQFERVLGPRGKFISQLRGLTDNSIDVMEAMRSGIALKSLGIIKNTDKIAELIARAGAAAKMAGKETGEGIKSMTEFFKTGSVANLEFLNIVARTNPALKAQLALLSQAGGPLGGVIQDTMKLALAQKLLRTATIGQLKGQRDLRDVLFDSKQSFTFLRMEIGQLIGKSLAPLIDKVTLVVDKFSSLLADTRKTDKGFQFLIKSLTVATTAVLGFASALGVLRLGTLLLNSLGFGLPGLILSVTALSAGFLGLTASAEGIIDKLSLLGNIFKGVFQLVSSLDRTTGIAKIDKDLKVLLERAGLMGFVENVAKVISVIKVVLQDLVESVGFVANKIDTFFGGISESFIKMIDKFREPWNKFWISDSISPVKKALRAIGVLLAGFAGFKVLKGILGGAGKLLSKIPIIGGLFKGGGFGKGPKGTANDPIYTKLAGMGGLLGALGGAATGGLGKKGLLKGIFNGLKGALGKFGVMLAPILKLLRPLLGKAALLFGSFKAGEFIGEKLGLDKTVKEMTKAKTTEGFEGGIVERAFFKLDKLFGGDTSRKFIENQKKLEQLMNKAPTPLKTQPRSGVTVPVQPKEADEQASMIQKLLETLKGDERKNIAEMIQEAFDPRSGKGAAISPEEWISIFRAALDTSNKLDTIATKDLKIEGTTGGISTRR